MQHVRYFWLIQGHLTQEDAIRMVNDSTSSLENVKLIGDYTAGDKQKQFLAVPAKVLVPKDEYNLNENKNNGFMALFQCHDAKNYKEDACIQILFQLLKQDFFN